MGDRDKSGKKAPRSSSPHPDRDRRITPVNPAPVPLNGPNRGRRDPHPDRDRIRDVFVLPPIRESRRRRPSSPHPNRRIIIDLPTGSRGRIWTSVRERVPTPFADPKCRIKRESKAHNVPEGILPSVDVGGAVGIGDNLQKPPSNYGCTSQAIPLQDETLLQSSRSEVEAIGFRHSMRNLFRSFTQSIRGNVSSFLGHGESSIEVPPPALPEATEGSQLATDESLSAHPSLESGSLNISNVDSSDNSDSETDDFKRPANVPVTYSSDESLVNTDSDGSRAAGSVADKPVDPSSEDPSNEDRSDSDKSPIPVSADNGPMLHSSEDIPREDLPDPDSDQSVTPTGPVHVPHSTEVGLVREEPLSDIEQAAYHDHVNPSGALSVESTDGTVQEDLYHIFVGSPVDIQIAYGDSGNVTTWLRGEQARYFEDGAQSDREDS